MAMGQRLFRYGRNSTLDECLWHRVHGVAHGEPVRVFCNPIRLSDRPNTTPPKRRRAGHLHTLVAPT
ncbi:hypothetical protein HCN51_46030 [Nonomuraea sp. FMUSA5-5]|uniref:Uncharacterized protein n=1 Tax=Nonomuraea composti TaxID=2720023 RepID=A0ABX1BJG4_9ACTN|nr:hypothetical protein [Nonomuraea sp. FMUSA5-5]NJP96710.1 hypothetical protein [Nonomuraea sp. FMUSA5-5]